MRQRHPQAGDAVAAPPVLGRPRMLDDDDVVQPWWGMTVFAVVVAAVILLEHVLLAHVVDWDVPWHLPTQSLLTPHDCWPFAMLGVAVTIGTWVLAKLEHRPFAFYGLRPLHPLRNLFGGSLAGIALLSAVVLLLHQMDLLVFHGQVLFGVAQQWKLAMQWLAFFALKAYAEEFLIHGYLQYTLTRALRSLLSRGFRLPSAVEPGFWIAAALLCCAVAVLHASGTGQTQLERLGAGLFSLLMIFSLWRTGSLWWALGYHMAWDWAQSFLWGVPNAGVRTRDCLFYTESTGPSLKSGGTAGPEGSIYMLGALFAGFGILMLLHKQRVYPELWPEPAMETGDAKQLQSDHEDTATATN